MEKGTGGGSAENVSRVKCEDLLGTAVCAGAVLGLGLLQDPAALHGAWDGAAGEASTVCCKPVPGRAFWPLRPSTLGISERNQMCRSTTPLLHACCLALGRAWYNKMSHQELPSKQGCAGRNLVLCRKARKGVGIFRIHL